MLRAAKKQGGGNKEKGGFQKTFTSPDCRAMGHPVNPWHALSSNSSAKGITAKGIPRKIVESPSVKFLIPGYTKPWLG